MSDERWVSLWLRRDELESPEGKRAGANFLNHLKLVETEGPCVELAGICQDEEIDDFIVAWAEAGLHAVGSTRLLRYNGPPDYVFWTANWIWETKDGGMSGYRVHFDEAGNPNPNEMQSISNFIEERKEVMDTMFKSDIERLADVSKEEQ